MLIVSRINQIYDFFHSIEVIRSFDIIKMVCVMRKLICLNSKCRWIIWSASTGWLWRLYHVGRAKSMCANKSSTRVLSCNNKDKLHQLLYHCVDKAVAHRWIDLVFGVFELRYVWMRCLCGIHEILGLFVLAMVCGGAAPRCQPKRQHSKLNMHSTHHEWERMR